MNKNKILLGTGSGGKLTHDFIKSAILTRFSNPILGELSDSAVLDYKERIAFTTDSFVVSPLFFPGGDIGKLAVSGTVNDLVMVGANPEYLSFSLIIEEGLDESILRKIIDSAAVYAKKAGVHIVTGDTKVVERSSADKLFINTSGIGRVIPKKKLSAKLISGGDKIILTGNIAEHGLSVLAKRKDLDLGFNIKSDVRALNGLLVPLLKRFSGIKFMRDPTRGGVATSLNEIAESSGSCLAINEEDIPVAPRIKAASELLGIDPLYVANEGKAILIVERAQATNIVRALQAHPDGRDARIIGEVIKKPRGRVILRTAYKTERILDMLTSEPLPRIC